jgi:KUP system potassium uptake protein
VSVARPATVPSQPGTAPPSAAAANHVAVAAQRPKPTGTWTLTVAAIGVVYGDLGTNPLFAMRECFTGRHGLPLTYENVLGCASLAVWALILVVSIKYCLLVLRADNEGEGGTLALLGKIPATKQRGGLPSRPIFLVVILVFGWCLLMGEGIVTPAISVLAAVEGIGVAQDRIVMYTAIILVLLFVAQRFGTARVGAVFGPVMLVWFAVIAAMGLVHIALKPGILAAVDPRHAIRLLRSGQPGSHFVLNAIILVVAGSEALYADMGHFGRRPIVSGWVRIVLPALALTYVGQCALLLRHPEAVENPFYAMAPHLLRYPLVLISTMATVIASQALISGAFSLSRQAVHLGFLPRLTIEHTSQSETGQIYVPFVNFMLMAGSVALVLGFRSSSALAGAYGLSVSGTMTTTTIGFFFVMWRVWRVPLPAAVLAIVPFLVIDLSFLGVNTSKIIDGGWVPLSVGLSVFSVVWFWRQGRRRVATKILGQIIPVDTFLARDDVKAANRVPGTAVYLTPYVDGIPPVLSHHLEHTGVLHEQVVLLSIVNLEIPFVDPKDRLRVAPLGHGFVRVTARYGYEEEADVPALLEACAIHEVVVDFDRVSYFVGSSSIRLRRRHGLLSIPGRLFAFMMRNSAPAFRHYSMPIERVIEIGMQYEV